MGDGSVEAERSEPRLQEIVASRYALVEKLSEGSAATVFRAVDIADGGKPVALKIILGSARSDVLEESFEREVDSLRRLRHDHVVRLLDAGVEDSGRRWIALEWLEGGTLADSERRKFLGDPARLVEILRTVLDALSAAHALGITHRDIKPGNILFDLNGNAKLADFNVSKLIGRTKSTKTLKHFFTLRWAAPEQVAGSATDERSDVFSLGRVVAELLTGYEGEDLPGLLKALDRPVGPGTLRHLLRRMLGDSVASRPTAREALNEIDAIALQLQPESVLALRLTRSVVDTLTNLQGGALTLKDALALVQSDLGGRLAVEPVIQASNRGGTRYTLVGHQFSYHAASPDPVDNYGDELTVVSIVRLAAHQRDRSRADCMEVPFRAELLPYNATPRKGNVAQAFESAFALAVTMREARRSSDSATKERIEAWDSYLELARALKQDRSRVGIASAIGDVREDGMLECHMRPLLLAPEELADALVNYVAPGGQIVRLGMVSEVIGSKLVIRPHDDLEDVRALPPGGQVLRDSRQEESSLQRQATALRMLRDRADAEGDLLTLLTHPDRAKAPTVRKITPLTEDLHSSNREIVELALGTDRLFLVQGPPGTGKTTVIAEIIAQILARESDSRILLVSQSNVAIDNVLERLQQLVPGLPAIRLGRPEKIDQGLRHLMLRGKMDAEISRLRNGALGSQNRLQDLRQYEPETCIALAEELVDVGAVTADRMAARELAAMLIGADQSDVRDTATRLKGAAWMCGRDDQWWNEIAAIQSEWVERAHDSDEFEDFLLEHMRVVAGTCVGVVQSKAIGQSRFEWVIVDEAGRAAPTELLVPLVRGRRLVLVGDERQLPPVLDEDIVQQVIERTGIGKEQLRQSLFQQLIEAVPATARSRLRRQYRMHPEIGGLIEHTFYPEGLEHAADVSKRQLGIEIWGAALRWLDTRDLDSATEQRVGRSYANGREIQAIVDDLQRIIPELQRRSGVTVGLLTGYLAQQEALREAVDKKKRAWSGVDVTVLTVDAAQGKEYDLVYYSAVRSNRQGRIGFLSDERRLNVALSRAKQGLTIVGDSQSLVDAGTRFGGNPFVGVRAWFSKSPKTRPTIRIAT